MMPFVARRWLLWLGCLACVGCTSPAIRSQNPETQLAAETQPRLVGDVASPFGTNYIQVEQVGLVTRLNGTGGDSPPSPQRELLMSEMKIRGVSNPSQVLSSPNSSMVLVRAYIPPGVQKGDPLDVEVRLPSQSPTTNLRGGWLLESRLTEIAVIGNQIHDGHLWALAEGPLLVDPLASGDADRGLLTHAKILGGGMATRTRDLGLVLRGDQKSIRTSAQIGAALNKRFHTYSHGIQQGVATPKTDEYIELAVLPRYKHNLARYMRVVRSVALQETETQRLQRLTQLEKQLLNPMSAGTAALQLEAIGPDAIKVLKRGLASSDPEIRFYAAEALAYLDQHEAAEPLGEIVRTEPVFRAFALTALSAMDDVAAAEVLRSLLDSKSVETRYGAFRALWAMNSKDPLARGESLHGRFSYHLISTTAPPLIHVTKSFRPEVVVFGPDQRLRPPFVLEAGNTIVIKGEETGEVTVTKLSTSELDQKRVVSTKVDDVIRAVVDVGGTYPDVVQALQQAKAAKALEGRFEVEALPDGARFYEHLLEEQSERGRADGTQVSSPLGELFGGGPKDASKTEKKKPATTAKSPSTSVQ